jgi:branched-chain amino acid transport system substrate-binding protein
LTPAQAQTALLQALDQHPDVIIGLPAASQVIALSPTIAQSGIPFFAMTSGSQILRGGPNGAPNLFSIRPLATDTAVAVANYIIKSLKAKKVGLVCVQNALGTDSCAAVRPVFKAAGVQIAADVSNSTTATDMTDVAIAMKGTDAVLDFNFPNPLGVLANQLVANGIDVPHIATSGAGVEANGGVVQGQALANLRGVDECTPQSDPSPAAKKFLKAYKAAYNETPIYSAAEIYDMVHFVYQAAQNAGSTDKTKLLKAANALTYKGVCATYHPDQGGVLVHAAAFAKWNPSGLELTDRVLTFPPVGAAGSTATTNPTSTTIPTATTKP